jgi:apolipoprotein N-acyltransferase
MKLLSPLLVFSSAQEKKAKFQFVFGDQQTHFFWVIDDVGFEEDQIELLISYIIAFFALHLHLGAVLSLIWLQVWTECCLDWSSSLDILGLSAVSYLRANCWVGR